MMGYRYENKLDEENHRHWIESLPAWKRITYKIITTMVAVVATVAIVGSIIMQL